MSDTGNPFAPGSRFAGLEIIREIGRGGAGIVYLARDVTLDRQVALKILHRSAISEDSAAIERFKNEALIAAKLEHPSIIPVYSTGVERNMPYLVIRYVPGRSLADLITEQGALSIGDAVRLLRPIANALDYAAEHDIVHRDVKPANILIDEAVSPPRALLSDFGIARAYEGTRHTATGGWVGTPDYIAPEVLKDDQPSGRSDQYSLACVLIEAASGISPFKRSNTAATITAHITETPDLTTIPGLDTQTESALAIALEKNPADRYATCTEFLDSVEVSIGRDSKATPHTIVRKRKRGKLTRRAKLAGGIALSLIAVAAAGADLLDIRNRITGQPQTTQPAATPQTTPTTNQPQTDILILGHDFKSAWSSSQSTNRNKEPASFKSGVDASDVLVSLLGEDARTTELRVTVERLKRKANCESDVADALTYKPSKAVVVLDSACLREALTAIRNSGNDLPPVYSLATGDGSEYLFPQLLVEPMSTFANASPEAIEWLNEIVGPVNNATFINMRGPSESSYGKAIAERGFETCSSFEWTTEVAQASELFELVRLRARRHLALGIGRDTSDAVVPIAVDFAVTIEPSPQTITGSRESDRELDRVIKERRSDGCFLVPWEIDPGNIAWIEKTVRYIVARDDTAVIYLVGSPKSDLVERVFSPGQKRRLNALVRSGDVNLLNVYPYAHPGSTGDQLENSGYLRFMRGSYWLFSDYAALFKTLELLAVSENDETSASRRFPQLEPQAWASGGESVLPFPPARLDFDSSNLEYDGDLVIEWYWNPRVRKFEWAWTYSGDPEVIESSDENALSADDGLTK